MDAVGHVEKVTQDRVINLFKKKLGYTYLGNWIDRENNSNIEDEYLTKYLRERKYSDALISRAIDKLRTTANQHNEGLYAVNKDVYRLLRYGVQVKGNAGENFETVELIDWKNPEKNHFALAEEVTLFGNKEKRPDIVIYVNGIALGVLELKRSIVSVGEGIRQNITNQRSDFIEPFFATIQYVLAGNDTEGLRYGAIKTPGKYFLTWKENSAITNPLDKYLLLLCEKKRFLEIIYDFTLFDGGIKKLCRPHQYFGVKAAQEFIKRKEGGIIWHTQGSGKSLTMVWLAKWILENNSNARVVIVTDRDELDKQIERVFTEAGEPIKRSKSGRDLMLQLSQPLPRLFCSLVHKFGNKNADDFEAFIKEVKEGPSITVGEIYVFVDECHRTQSGKLHRAMKAIMNNAVFIGFTGTPLLKEDKKTSLEIFGRYIHTYKFKEAVQDNVVLDLLYEARDIDQIIASKENIDEWFELKTKGLNSFQKSELKRRWGTMQKVFTSKSRLDKIVLDIVMDFSRKQRLSSGYGNAMLVVSSIYEACRYFERFQSTGLNGKCAIITSYNPATRDIVTEDTGENTETEREYIYNIYKNLLGSLSTEKYEENAKTMFVKEPANMKLLIVVDKLLTGFDAPPCTYLYIDKSMQDHGLFQAICRVNRLDSEDKNFGYIVDYKDLFKKVGESIQVYTADLDYDNFKKEEVDILVHNRLVVGRTRLNNALEEIELLCEPVSPPKGEESYLQYFCGDTENAEELKKNEFKRVALYVKTAELVRALADISDEMLEAGYSQSEINHIKNRVDHFIKIREAVRLAATETIDMKKYEADMRFLIDNFIEAGSSRKLSSFDDNTLMEIILKIGLKKAMEELPDGIKNNKEAAAETIENNVRRKIIKEHLTDPVYFEKMSQLLTEIIKQRKQNAINYQKYLKQIEDLIKNLDLDSRKDLPARIKTRPQKALYSNLNNNLDLALQVDEAVITSRRDGWRGNSKKENEIKKAIYNLLNDVSEVERIFEIIKNQDEY